MSKAELKCLLLDIESHASRHQRACDNKTLLIGDLEKIAELISNEQCARCARNWKRGGRREGSELCQSCYDTP